MNTTPSDVPLRSKKLLWVGSRASLDSWRESSQKPAITASGTRKMKYLFTGHLPFRQNHRIAGVIANGSLGAFGGNLCPAMAADGHRQILLASAFHEDMAGISFEGDI